MVSSKKNLKLNIRKKLNFETQSDLNRERSPLVRSSQSTSRSDHSRSNPSNLLNGSLFNDQIDFQPINASANQSIVDQTRSLDQLTRSLDQLAATKIEPQLPTPPLSANDLKAYLTDGEINFYNDSNPIAQMICAGKLLDLADKSSLSDANKTNQQSKNNVPTANLIKQQTQSNDSGPTNTRSNEQLARLTEQILESMKNNFRSNQTGHLNLAGGQTVQREQSVNNANAPSLSNQPITLPNRLLNNSSNDRSIQVNQASNHCNGLHGASSSTTREYHPIEHINNCDYCKMIVTMANERQKQIVNQRLYHLNSSSSRSTIHQPIHRTSNDPQNPQQQPLHRPSNGPQNPQQLKQPIYSNNQSIHNAQLPINDVHMINNIPVASFQDGHQLIQNQSDHADLMMNPNYITYVQQQQFAYQQLIYQRQLALNQQVASGKESIRNDSINLQQSVSYKDFVRELHLVQARNAQQTYLNPNLQLVGGILVHVPYLASNSQQVLISATNQIPASNSSQYNPQQINPNSQFPKTPRKQLNGA